MAKENDVSEIVERAVEQIEPLSDEEAADAFMAIMAAMDRECCCGAATVQNETGEGIEIRMYVSAERCRRWIELKHL